MDLTAVLGQLDSLRNAVLAMQDQQAPPPLESSCDTAASQADHLATPADRKPDYERIARSDPVVSQEIAPPSQATCAPSQAAQQAEPAPSQANPEIPETNTDPSQANTEPSQAAQAPSQAAPAPPPAEPEVSEKPVRRMVNRRKVRSQRQRDATKKNFARRWLEPPEPEPKPEPEPEPGPEPERPVRREPARRPRPTVYQSIFS